MKKYFSDHPIITALLLGVCFMLLGGILSVINGRHNSYRLYHDGDRISDVQMKQFSEDDSSADLF